MGIDVMRQGDRVHVQTYDQLGNGRTYRKRIYDTPDGDSVVVDDDDLTRTVVDALEGEGYDVRDEKPERYLWRSDGPNQNHAGIFTIEEKVGTDGMGANVYETDCGRMFTSTDLEIGETYETYQKDLKHYGYRTVDVGGDE